MRVTSILLTGALALLASAQTTSGNAPTAVNSEAAAASSAQAESLRCINACDASDVTCKAKCIAVPSPNDEQAIATNKCVTECPIGKGTEADNKAYGECVSGCIGAHYYTSSAGTPQPTSGAGSGSGSNNGNNNSGNNDSNDDSNTNSDASGTGNNEASPTESGAAPSSSTGAAQINQISGAAAGLVGFMAAVLAL